MNTQTVSMPSIRGKGTTSAIIIYLGQYTMSVEVDGAEVLSKIRGLPWTVGLDCEPWQIADAALALCECREVAV
ncbi:hypothetical protein [Pseudohongiella acticola]|uniref:hypothetical protein n=1 Tax=Pseudohongiella acticola TaxID=1524254 RepID=UPI0030EB81D6